MDCLKQLFLVADATLQEALSVRWSIRWSARQHGSKSRRTSVLDAFVYVCIWEGAWGVDGVGFPCPPVRSDIVTRVTGLCW